MSYSPRSGPDTAESSAVSSKGTTKQQRAAEKKNSGGSGSATVFQCCGFGDCRMVFTRSEHLARHVRKHTGERPFQCHCQKSFSRLDNLRQHCQTVHSDTPNLNEEVLRKLTALHANLAATAAKNQRTHGRIIVPQADVSKADEPTNKRRKSSTSIMPEESLSRLDSDGSMAVSSLLSMPNSSDREGPSLRRVSQSTPSAIPATINNHFSTSFPQQPKLRTNPTHLPAPNLPAHNQLVTSPTVSRLPSTIQPEVALNFSTSQSRVSKPLNPTLPTLPKLSSFIDTPVIRNSGACLSNPHNISSTYDRREFSQVTSHRLYNEPYHQTKLNSNRLATSPVESRVSGGSWLSSEKLDSKVVERSDLRDSATSLAPTANLDLWREDFVLPRSCSMFDRESIYESRPLPQGSRLLDPPQAGMSSSSLSTARPTFRDTDSTVASRRHITSSNGYQQYDAPMHRRWSLTSYPKDMTSHETDFPPSSAWSRYQYDNLPCELFRKRKLSTDTF